jgi:oxaloacetate decarboxylase alpha subunit
MSGDKKVNETEIQYVDQTIRDAQQSLWGNMMPTDMILPIASVMDRVGYKAIGFSGPRAGTVATRHLHESIFERCRLLSKKIVNTPLRTSLSSWAAFGFYVEPLATNELWIKRTVANGIKSFWFCNYQNMVDREKYLVRVARAEGAEVVGGLMYALSPVHTDELWAKKTRIMVEIGGISTIQLEDAGGVLTPERTRSFVQAVEKESQGIPIEFHSHCNVGMAPVCYVEAMKAGIRAFHTAVSPLANGSSLPSIENTIRNARRLGYTTNLDLEALKAMSDHFRKEAEKRGMRLGVPMEYDLFQYWHQIPGGMMGTMRNQLAEIKQEHRLEEMLEEVGRVRQEFGYPVMATPYSQLVGAQALFNVTAGERYKIVSDEVVRYMLGHYGEPDGPIDPNIKDKILGSPKAKRWLTWKEPEVTVEDLRRLEPGLSDDELLLKIASPEGEFRDKLRALYGWT